MSRARKLWQDDTFAAVRMLPRSDGLFIDLETLSVDEDRTMEKARAVERRLPTFGREYPVLGVVRVCVDIALHSDEDRLNELARERKAAKK